MLPSSDARGVGALERSEYELLEEFLRALAHSRRLEMLSMLRVPRALQDIRLAPGRARAGDNPDRPVSRQAVQEHLDKLLEIGVVTTTEGSGRARTEYIVNAQRVFQVAEEFRRVAMITVGGPVARDATLDAADPAASEMPPGPKLVLVHGYLEGKVFPLRSSDVGEDRAWTVGRKPGLPVSLEYDPYVSLVNSRIVPAAGGFTIADLGTSRNGTWVNWRRVGADPARLAQGDVLRVGRSLLVFRAV